MEAYTKQNKQEGISKKNLSKTENEEISWVKKISEGKKTAEELMTTIISEIEAPLFYYKQVNEICNHLNKIMKFFYRNSEPKIVLFGSSHTKLAIRDSDVDIYLDFEGNLPKPAEVLVRSLKNQVRKFGYFIKSVPIFARVPIVHCVHRSRLSCDLSFLNAFGVLNSHLIKFLLSIDKRLKPIILILKFLMKSQGLTGKNALNSFAFVSLIIFFLQVIEDPIIPSVCYLQSLATKRKTIMDWDGSFTTEINLLPPVSNQLSVIELIQKFFEFYSDFEFGFYVLSLFTAKTYLKPIFSDVGVLPEEFQVYKANLAKNESYKFEYNKFMCVQDPFDHSKNITRIITQKWVLQFQNLCCTYAVMGQELLKSTNSEENKMKYLQKLFNQKTEIPKSKRVKAKDIVICFGENIIFDNCNCTEDDLRNEWSKHIFNSVKDILCKVMKCKIDVQPEVSGNESTSFGSDEKLIKCVLPYYEFLTKKRNEVKNEFEFPQDMPAIKREEIISDYLCDTVLKGAKNVSLKFEITCYVKKKPTCFCIILESKETQRANSELVQRVFQFIQNHFPKWLK